MLVEVCTVIVWSGFRALARSLLFYLLWLLRFYKKKLALEVPGMKNCLACYTLMASVITVSSYATRHVAPRGVPQVEKPNVG
jgi:hypothetical protein